MRGGGELGAKLAWVARDACCVLQLWAALFEELCRCVTTRHDTTRHDTTRRGALVAFCCSALLQTFNHSLIRLLVVCAVLAWHRDFEGRFEFSWGVISSLLEFGEYCGTYGAAVEGVCGEAGVLCHAQLYATLGGAVPCCSSSWLGLVVADGIFDAHI